MLDFHRSSILRLARWLAYKSIILFFLLLTCFIFLSLWSYYPYDPCTDVATDAIVSNCMGSFGALFSNFLFQWLGWGAWPMSFLSLALFFHSFLYIPVPLSSWLLIGLGSSLCLKFLEIMLIVSKRDFFSFSTTMKGFLLGLLCLAVGFFIMKYQKIASFFQKNLPLKKPFLKRKNHKNTKRVKPVDDEEKDQGAPTKNFEVLLKDPESSPASSFVTEKNSLLPAKKHRLQTLAKKLSLPPLTLLQEPPLKGKNSSEISVARLQSVLVDFGVKGTLVKGMQGPVVSLYELTLAPGVKSSRVISLADDLARATSALSVRVSIIPGKGVIGIEVAHTHREPVFIKEILSSEAYSSFSAPLALALGKDIKGDPFIADLSKMPHMLVAGTTGSGKSVGINTMILSLLYRLGPDQCKLLLIDPKMLELSVYNGIPHLLTPVLVEPDKAVMALKWVVHEMENRYRLMAQVGVRHIGGYHHRLVTAAITNEPIVREVQVGFNNERRPLLENQSLDLPPLPFIVVIVDEMADLMMVAGKEVETAVQRLAQMARAAGIHLIMATQRPSVDVITGTIKANFPTRLSFQVTSKIDSRTILGEQGAEHLLGQGDMLFMASGGRISRLHGAFVSEEEIDRVVAFLKKQSSPSYVSIDEQEKNFS